MYKKHEKSEIMKHISVILFILIFFFPGCVILYHEPSTPNIPLLDSTHFFDIEGTLTNHGIEAKSNILFAKYVVVQATAKMKIYRPDNLNKAENGYYEAATGLLYNYENFYHFSILGGIGQGNSYFQESNAGMDITFWGEGNYNKYFFQPSVAIGGNKNKFGVAVKMGMLDYKISYVSREYLASPFNNFRGIYLNKFYKLNTVESSIFYRHNFNNSMMCSCYLGLTSYNSNIPVDKLLDNYFLMGISFGFRLDKQLLKKDKF